MTKKTLWEGAINKKIILLLLIGFLFLVGVSFALWQITLTQEDKNFVTSACFEVTLEEQNDILLESAYPIKDEEGMKLTPYTFTIENVCNTIAFYQVNLEELETNQKKLPDKYIKVSLNHSTGKLLNTYEEVTKTLENATTSHKLTSGSLKEGEKNWK